MDNLNEQFEFTDGVLSASFNDEAVEMTLTEDGILTPNENLYSFGVDSDGLLSPVDRVATVEDNPLAKLWVGKATIYEYQDTEDPITHQTTQTEKPVLVNEPCRLSYNYEQSTNMSNGAAVVSQSITLFIRPDLKINPGSVIEITQHGVTEKYKGSGNPAVYCHHQQITLELYDNEA